MHYITSEYNAHNLFGFNEARATATVLEQIQQTRAVGTTTITTQSTQHNHTIIPQAQHITTQHQSHSICSNQQIELSWIGTVCWHVDR